MKNSISAKAGKMFKTFSGAFKACMVGAIIALTGAAWADTAVVNGMIWTYALSTKGEAMIDGVTTTSGSKPTGAVTIPSSLNSHTVTILRKGFKGCTGVTSVTIPSTVTWLQNEAFSGCTGLTSVSIPSSVNQIAYAAFEGCTSLKSISISGSVTLGTSVFRNCTALTSVTIGSGVKSIPASAFSGCSALTSIYLPSTVTSLDSYAFENCSKLKTARMPKALMGTFTETAVFSGNASGLEIRYYGSEKPSGSSYTFSYEVVSAGAGGSRSTELIKTDSSGNESLAVSPNPGSSATVTVPSTLGGYNVTSIGTFAFQYAGMGSVSLPSSLKTIKEYAFWDCEALKSVTIPDSVTKLEIGAFYSCPQLATVSVPKAFISNLNETSVFASCSSNLRVTYRVDASTSAQKSGNYYWYYRWVGGYPELYNGTSAAVSPKPTTSISAPSYLGGLQLKSVGQYAFFGCSSMTGVTLPTTVTNVGASAFYGCTKLASVSGLTNVKGFGASAFYNCSALTSITIPSVVKSIGAYAFKYCIALKNISIPASVTSMGTEAFYGCSGLTSVTIGSGLTSISEATFRNCSALTRIYIPSTVTSIGNNAFNGCTKLYEAHLPKALLGKLGTYAFANCAANLETRYRGSETPSGSSYSWDYEIVDRGGVKWAEVVYLNSSFSYTYALNNLPSSGKVKVTMPSTLGGYTVRSIGQDAFKDRSTLGELVMPTSVTNISSYAFRGAGITTVAVLDNVKTIGNYAFKDCTSLKTAFLPGALCGKINESLVFSGCPSDLVIVYRVGDGVMKQKVGNYFWHFRKLPNGTVEIISPGNDKPAIDPKPTGAVTIPSSLGGLGVTSLGGSAFDTCTGLTGVGTIPSTITNIGAFVFWNCSGLKSITLPSSLKSIGVSAFYQCSNANFTNVVMPSSLTSIGANAFKGCTALKTVRLGTGTTTSSLKTIGANAFEGCSALTYAYVPSSVTTIGNNAFKDCTNLTKIHVPDSTFFGKISQANICSGCASDFRIRYYGTLEKDGFKFWFERITNNDTVLDIELARWYTTAFGSAVKTSADATPTGKVTIPSSISGMSFTSIGNGAFFNLTSLTEVVIPSTVKRIVKYAFDKSGITTVTVPDSVTTLENYAFRNCASLATASLPGAFFGAIDESLVFKNSPNVKITYRLSGSVKAEKSGDYYWCYRPQGTDAAEIYRNGTITGDNPAISPKPTGSASISIPSTIAGKTVKSIGYGAFASCPGIAEVEIPNTVTNIGWYAFYKTSLTSVTIPGSVVAIGRYAFSQCTNLTSVSLSNGLKVIDGWAFYICPELTEVVIPDTVTKIETAAFAKCSKLTTVTIGSGVTSIGTSAFVDTALTTVYVRGGNVDAVKAMFTSSGHDISGITFIDMNAWLVTFNANGGMGGTTRSVKKGNTLGTLPSTSRTGYTFQGWYTDPVNGTKVTTSTKPTSDVTYYAHWQVNQYTLTFDANGGTGGTSMKLDYGSTFVAPTVTRTGYTFEGWSPALPSKVPAANTTYTAQWEEIPVVYYTVTFDAHGGSGGTTRQVESGKAVGTLPSTSRSGYTFNGWYTAVSGGTKISASTTVTADVTYHAQWTVVAPTMYTVTFNANGASGSTTRSVESGKPVGTLPEVSRTGYTLLGWFTAASGGTQIDEVTTVTAAVTYYAHWQANEYVVTFNANGGECDTPSKTVTYDATYGELPAATRNNYTFNGWFTAATGGSKVEATTKVTITADQTLFAQWTEIPQVVMRTVTFDAQGGSEVASRTVADGAAVGTLPATSRSGYTFNGWFTAATGGTKISATTTVTANVTYYAQWTQSATTTYTVMFDAKGGTASKTEIKVNEGAQIGTQLPTASRTGYKFNGWFTGTSDPVDASTVVNANMSCWASWQPNQYKLTLNANGGSVSPTEVDILYDSVYGSLHAPVRDGYTFTGWFTAQNGGTKIAETTVFKQTVNQTLYAHWEETAVIVDKHTVTFNPFAPDATVSPASIEVEHNEAIGTLPEPVRPGYTFVRWTAMGVEIKPTTLVVEDFVCRAEWEANTYTVTFNAVGGSVTPADKEVTYDSAYGALPSPTLAGYNFKGWFTERDGAGTQVTPGTVLTRAEDHTLYANWEEIPHGTFSVTFDAAGGICSEPSRSVVDGDQIGVLPAVDRTGYDFLGWTDSLGNSVSEATVVSADMVCVAQWQAKSFTVTFSANGGTVTPTSKPVTFDSTYGELPTPELANYTFAGWYTDTVTGVKVTADTVVSITADLVLYARWVNSAVSAWIDTSKEPNVTWYYRMMPEGDGVELYNAGSCVVSPVQTGEVEIPKTIEGYPVVRIGDYAFSGCVAMTGVTIPFTVTSIGKYAFTGCGFDYLLTIPGLVKTIEMGAFLGCESLKYLAVGASVEEMGDAVFENCTSLQSVAWYDTPLKSLAPDTFNGCTSLATTFIPPDAEVVGGGAFSHCAMETARILKNVKKIELWAFEGTPLRVVQVSPLDVDRVRQMLIDAGVDVSGITFEVLDLPVELTAGKFVKVTLEELGFGYYKPAEDGTPYTVTALGLPSGLKLKSNAAVKNNKGKVIKKAKVDWWIEGVPTTTLDYVTQPSYFIITADGVKNTVEFQLSVAAQTPTDLNDPSLWDKVSRGQSFTADDSYTLPDVGKGWTVSGLPTGLKFATKRVTKKSGSKTVTVAEPYTVYGKTTKAGLFTITAKKKISGYFETLKFKVLVTPNDVSSEYFGSLSDKKSVAHEDYVEWYLEDDVAADGVKVTKVTGLPTGLTFAAKDTYAYTNAKKKTGKYLKQEGQTIMGWPTKAGTFVVTFTKNVKVGKKTVAKTAQILWTVSASSVKPESDFNDGGYGIESVPMGVKFSDWFNFAVTKGATVTASGLPKGISLQKVDDETWSLAGATTKAGTYLVTVKITKNGNTVMQRRAIQVDPLPTWVKGTFPGHFVDSESNVSGMGSLTVSTAGKISGKFVDSGKTWTYSAASFTQFDGTTFTVPVTAKYSYKVKNGKKTETKTETRKFTLTVYEGSYGGSGEANLVEDGGTAHFEGFQNLWGSKYKPVGRKLFYTSAKKQYKIFSTTLDVAGQSCPVSVKITSAGAVTATLTYDTGKKSRGKVVYYKPTCSTVVKPTSDPDPDSFTGLIQLYFAPSTGNNFPVAAVDTISIP